MQFFFGMFLADLQNHPPAQQFSINHSWTRRFLPPIVILAGLFLASYPEDKAEWMPWSKSLAILATYIIPTGHDLARFFTAFGVQLIVLGIHFSPRARGLLSNRCFLWLGRQSFAVYLLHGPLIRSVLAYCLYGITLPARTQDENGEWHDGPRLELRGPLLVAVVLPLWFLFMYTCAAMWTKHVDPMCARWTQWIEDYVAVPESEKGGLPAYS
jgi:hypothetical protein